MPYYNRQNIDRNTNKPQPKRTQGVLDDPIFNRAEQTRRDDDVIKTPKRTIYDIDFAIKWYIENEIQPQIMDRDQIIPVPVIFANGEKWDNVRRLGYLRDEKGMLQSPLIMLKRNSVVERDSYRGLDVNLPQNGNVIVYKGTPSYNERNRYLSDPYPPTNRADSEKIYVVEIPKYVTLEYDIMLWTDFTTQMNDLIDQMLPYNRFAWGNEANRFSTSLGSITTETINAVGEDRLVRSTIPATVLGTLLSGQEARQETIKKMYSVKKVTFGYTVTDDDLFTTTIVPQPILQSGGGNIITSDGRQIQITVDVLSYLTSLRDEIATYSSSNTVIINTIAAVNPVTNLVATVNEFNVYINGQYIDKACYTWTPTDVGSQTIIFDTNILGFTLDAQDVVVVNGRWA